MAKNNNNKTRTQDRNGGTLKTQRLFVCKRFFCCAFPNSDIIFSMTKEVTLRNKKKNESLPEVCRSVGDRDNRM